MDAAIEVDTEVKKYLLEDVFKLSGVPTVTFVKPPEYSRLKVALRTKGRGVVIEGPSGIGKTSSVKKALEELGNGLGGSILELSARRQKDLEDIQRVARQEASGLVIIDDFHRLDAITKNMIADYLKILSDEENEDTKIVVIGINEAGKSLVLAASDVGSRIEVIKFEKNPDTYLEKLIEQGCGALNIDIPFSSDIIAAANGSFNITQLLCHEACLVDDVTETRTNKCVLTDSFGTVQERVLDRLSLDYFEVARRFAKGKKLRREGRAPYLQVLRWLSQSTEWALSVDREMAKHSELRGSVGQIVNKGHLKRHIEENSDISEMIHYDSESKIIAIENPKFFYYIRNLKWNTFAERIGYLDVQFSNRYDFALSFAGSDRDVAEKLYEFLADNETSPFYDKNEQERIAASTVEEYLVPIYESEATFVIAIMGPDYPNRIWTKLESKAFRQRLGENAVIPIWFKGVEYGVFEASRELGGYELDRSSDVSLDAQIKVIGTSICKKLHDLRIAQRQEAAADIEPDGA